MSEKLALQQTGRNRRAIHFYKSSFSTRAQIEHRPYETILASADLPENQNSRASRSNRFNLLQHPLQNVAIADDLLEIAARSQFIFKVKLLILEPRI